MLFVCIYVSIGVFHRFIRFQSWATNIGSRLHTETLSMLFQKQTLSEGPYMNRSKNPKKMGPLRDLDSHQLNLQKFIPELQKSRKKCVENTTSAAASVMYLFLNSQPLRTMPLSFKASRLTETNHPNFFGWKVGPFCWANFGGESRVWLVAWDAEVFVYSLRVPLVSAMNAKIMHIKVQTHSENIWKKHHVQKTNKSTYNHIEKKDKTQKISTPPLWLLNLI